MCAENNSETPFAAEEGNSRRGSGGGSNVGQESDFSESLHGYLRRISEVHPLESDDQQSLINDIFEVRQHIRMELANFVPIAESFCRLLDSQRSAGRLIRTLFESYILKLREPDEKKQGSYIQLWYKKVQESCSEIRANFSSGNLSKSVEARKKLKILMMDLEFSADLLEKYTLEILNSKEVVDDIEAFACKQLMSREDFDDSFSALAGLWDMLGRLKNRMIESNLRLVIRIAQGYRYRGLPFNDLIQEGNLGLMRALVKFDTRLNTKFSTYASWWIKHNISRALAEQSRIIRIPMHMYTAISRINRAEEEFILENGREPELEELAPVLNLSAAKLNAIKKMARQTISLQSPVSCNDPEINLEDILPSESLADPRDDVSKDIIRIQMEKMFSKLSERDRQIITMRFGLDGKDQLTAAEIGKRLNLSRERIRQIELRILGFLREESKNQLDDCNQVD